MNDYIRVVHHYSWYLCSPVFGYCFGVADSFGFNDSKGLTDDQEIDQNDCNYPANCSYSFYCQPLFHYGEDERKGQGQARVEIDSFGHINCKKIGGDVDQNYECWAF